MGRRLAALIRHGDYLQRPGAPSAHQPFPLNAAGEEHARQAGVELQALAVESGATVHPVIDSSNLLRGWQTATILRDALDPAFTVEGFDALAERGLGSAANLTVEEIEAVLAADPRFDAPPADWKANSHYRLPLQGAESLMDAGARVAAHLSDRMEALEGGADVIKVFVGHGAAFRHAAHHLGVLSFDDIARLSMYHGRPVLLEVADDGRWSHVGGEWKIRSKGEVALD